VIALAFLWHQHQPYYPDDVAGENPMPWVRLHGVKDYYGMALHLLEFPEMACTINLVPSLVHQLQAYTDRGATDRFLEVSRLPADDDPASRALRRALPAARCRAEHCAGSSAPLQ
jgi:alpha-amylase/alpha-mannosidase (GH57 family)